MEIFAIEFYIVLLLLINLVFVFLIVYFLRKMRTSMQIDASKDAAKQVATMMDPLLKEADKVAHLFESQINEKKQIIDSVNDKLDSRILDLKFMLEKAENAMKKASDYQNAAASNEVKQSKKSSTDNGKIEVEVEEIEDLPKSKSKPLSSQQDMIFELHNKGYDAEDIAKELSLLKREVNLALSLKKKLMFMEKN